MKYSYHSQDSFIIYFDILSYKNIVLGNNTRDINDLRQLILDLDIPESIIYQFFNPEIFKTNIYRKSFSDNFLYVIPRKFRGDKEDAEILKACCFLATFLQGLAIKKGYLLRGSIVYGELEINKNILFGKGIVEAYELESSHNKPNIVLSSNLKKIYNANKFHELDILSPFNSGGKNYKSASGFLKGIQKMINRINEYPIVDDSIIKKYEYLIEEFNRFFQGVYPKQKLNSKPGYYEIICI